MSTLSMAVLAVGSSVRAGHAPAFTDTTKPRRGDRPGDRTFFKRLE
jgi:hypothetical protein